MIGGGGHSLKNNKENRAFLFRQGEDWEAGGQNDLEGGELGANGVRPAGEPFIASGSNRKRKSGTVGMKKKSKRGERKA